MRRLLCLLLCVCFLTGCSGSTAGTTEPLSADQLALQSSVKDPDISREIPFESRFSEETLITLSDDGAGCDSDAVFLSKDIIYYEDRDTYDSGFPYGEGSDIDKHTAEEAAAHTVVNITKPGTYRVTGTLSQGQIRVDLGEDAYEDPSAVVELILDNANITCSVAPAIVFLNVYECDGSWSVETAKSDVDTSMAGANLILAENSVNTVRGNYVAKIYKDKDGEKKLWKQDGAIYSYMSLNVFGPGRLDLYADNEGLDTELHLTINGGQLNIYSDNDGINTNEDGVSVTTIQAGTIHIIAGLGIEGDGIDSNGYLVINGGTVISSANPIADAGLDSDLGSYINGGVVLALGSTMDWAESESDQVTLNLQFAASQEGDHAIVIRQEDSSIVFAYDADTDEVLGTRIRQYMGAIISTPHLKQGSSYEVYLDGVITGEDTGGLYTLSTITGYTGGEQMQYTGTDVGMGGHGFGGMGQKPFQDGEKPSWPDGEAPSWPDGEMPSMPEGEIPSRPEGEMPVRPEGGRTPPEDGGFPGFGGSQEQAGNIKFYMNDKVNAFSGVCPAT